MKLLAGIKKMFDFSNYSSKSNFYDDSNKLVIGKMKDEMLRRFSFLIVNNKHKKTKGVDQNVAGKIVHNEYKNVLLKNQCLRHLVNRI